MFDKFKEECGLIGVWNHTEAANIAYLGLYAQQHRGQEGAGVTAVNDGSPASMRSHRGLGLVADVFSKFDFKTLPGKHAIGHVRYTTAGGSQLANVQPFQANISFGSVALAHNGNLINADSLKEELVEEGAIFSSTSDTEVILHLLARIPKKGGKRSVALIETLISVLKKVKGAYSLLFIFEDRIIAVRDPNGFRPLSLGSLNGSLLVASETCAFDLVGASFIRDIDPGEIVEIWGNNQQKSYFPFERVSKTPCIFEYIYFSRPDSNVYGRNVYVVRKRLGHELAREHPVCADVVVPVPDSGVTAAIGYSEESKIPLEYGLIRNHYVGRTFIEPKQSIRDFGVKIKHNANPAVLKGKSVVVVDDSVVRGTTSKKLVDMLRQAGAREVHMRISSPPTIDPCFYGIDTPKKEELIASCKKLEEIKEYLNVDSLAYLSIEGMYRAVYSEEEREREPLGINTKRGFCDACFSGNYPIGTPYTIGKKQGELFDKG